jgi:hypothetical protein
VGRCEDNGLFRKWRAVVVGVIPALGRVGELAALPGIQTHGEYHLTKPEFGGRTGVQVGCDILTAFRR